MTPLLGTQRAGRRATTPGSTTVRPGNPGWHPLPDDVIEWMGMNPYPPETA